MGTGTDLLLGVILHEQHIDNAELIHEPVALELLAHARADRRDREGDRVHGLDLGSLGFILVSGLDWTGIIGFMGFFHVDSAGEFGSVFGFFFSLPCDYTMGSGGTGRRWWWW